MEPKNHSETEKNHTVSVNPDDGPNIVGLNLYLTQVMYNFEYTVDAVAYIMESIPDVGPRYAEHFSYYIHRRWDHVTDKLMDQADNLVPMKPGASNSTEPTPTPMLSTGSWYL